MEEEWNWPELFTLPEIQFCHAGEVVYSGEDLINWICKQTEFLYFCINGWITESYEFISRIFLYLVTVIWTLPNPKLIRAFGIKL